MDPVETLRKLADFLEQETQAQNLIDAVYDLILRDHKLSTEDLKTIYSDLYALEEYYNTLDLLAYDIVYSRVCDIQSGIDDIKNTLKDRE